MLNFYTQNVDFLMREQNEGFSESKLDKKKYKINNTRINIKAKNNSEDNTMKTTKKTHIGDYAVV
jgi:predicted membrane protein